MYNNVEPSQWLQEIFGHWIFHLCVWIDFHLRFFTSSFVGSFTFLIFVSFQQKKYLCPIGLISNVCFVFRVSIANARNWQVKIKSKFVNYKVKILSFKSKKGSLFWSCILRIVLDKTGTFNWESTMFCFRQTWNNSRHIKIG